MYIQMISAHGLIRGENIEMGRDADTGGQVRYVVELAKTLGTFDEVEQVDLFTRRIRDKRVSSDYSVELEQLGPKSRIVRLPCGGSRYTRKERLWPALDDYVDAMIAFTRREGRTPAVVHGHYADAGYLAREVAAVFNVPFVFTAHSLGKSKLAYLQEEGWTPEAANREFHVDHRISVEQACLAAADMVVVSTSHERDWQYRGYFKDPQLRFEVIPPGTDLDRFFPFYDYDMPHADIDERFKQARVRMTRALDRFFFDPEKPLILALCRPDARKNIGALIEAYGQSNELQAMANLAVFAGIRKNIEEMGEGERQVLTEMLLAMDRFDLYGKLAVPKRHDSEYEVPELYRIAAEKRGVYINATAIELFGLTLIESSACGLPFVAGENGGPRDIVDNCHSGLLVDVGDGEALTAAIVRMLTDVAFWDKCSANGVNRVRENYSWRRHGERYLKCLDSLADQPARTSLLSGTEPPGRRLASVEAILITDIDNTLVGDDEGLELLCGLLKEHREHLAFGVASGRSIDLVVEALEDNGIDDIDVIISSVGTEIYYGNARTFDKGWASRLRPKWRPDRIREVLERLEFLSPQEDVAQRDFKVSYDLDEHSDPDKVLPQIHEALDRARIAYSLVFSHGTYVDVLPHRASKGKAVRYLAGKWSVPLNRIATAGDSGNDRDMLVGQTCGIVVSNHSDELESLRKSKASQVYFAKYPCAGGIVDGLYHFGFLDRPTHPESGRKLTAADA